VTDNFEFGGPNVRRSIFSCLALAAGLFWLLLCPSFDGPQPVQGDDVVQPESQAVPVERSMHEFMEYFFQPTYQRLKPLMASAPTANPGWKAIKADALILAEGGNLLLLRKSAKDPIHWSEYSLAVRDAGGQLYKAARKKDFVAARQAYEQMLTHCNRCHTQFAGGKHQLAP
jgi:hypothetical protein